MRLLSLPVGNDLIEVHVCMWTGKEKVYWNGEQVSSKWHCFGSRHFFTVDAPGGEGIDTVRVLTSYGIMGYRYDVFYNDQCLLASGRTDISLVNKGSWDQPKQKVVHVSRKPAEELSLKELEEQLV